MAMLLAVLLLAARVAYSQGPKPAQPDVAASNLALQSRLPFSDRQDFTDAMRGFIATVPDNAHPNRYGFLKQDPPPTVNPSLWRQAQLDAINGLFKVTDGVYQIRDFSVSNMTVVEGRTGIIVIDTLATPGAAHAALDLYFAHRPRRPVMAVIYTHSHGDHFGGASALVSPADAAAGKMKVIAPVGFMEAIFGDALAPANLGGRRGQYQFGAALPFGERGFVDYGEGKNESRGPSGPGPIVPPNDIIRQPMETRTIDGVVFRFELALDSEAPSEMMIYLPQSHVLDVAELATHTLHNLEPLRGSQVRDANRWSQYLNTALDRFGADVQVMIDQHQWPVWGNERVRTELGNKRDLYKYLNDQTIRMMNQGLGPTEIAETLTTPPGLENDWSAHGLYGNLSQDAKAVYQRYVGWYDGNPATLDRLPRVEEAKKYVEYMGGEAAVVARARDDFKAGQYLWVAEVMDQVVFADPSNKEARSLAADAFEQLGYLAESAPWRNSYLFGAEELRDGVQGGGQLVPAISPGTLHAMPIAQVFDYLGTRIDAPRAGTARIVINWRFSDTHELLASTLEHGALTWIDGKGDPKAGATVTTTRSVFEGLVLGQRTISDAMKQGALTTVGNPQAVSDLWGLLDEFKTNLPIVEPGEAAEPIPGAVNPVALNH